MRKIASNEAHTTWNWQDDNSTKGAEKYFKRLLHHGLKSGDRCVDYGCGTLRLGIRVMRYLDRGDYWGLDIAEDFLKVGRELIGEELYRDKRPNLKVINQVSVDEAAEARPDLLFSAKVLHHVHPSELENYLSNVMTIIGHSGRAIIMGSWSSAETLKLGRSGWAHGIGEIEAALSSRARLTILSERDGGEDARRRKGDLLLDRVS